MQRSEFYGSIAYPDQAAHRQSNGLEHAPDLAIAAFTQGRAIPDIPARPAGTFQHIEVSGPVIEFDPRPEPPKLRFGYGADHANGVFARYLVARVHEPVSEFTVRGEKQQAERIEIEAADGDPSSALRPRQRFEYQCPALPILPARQFAGPFVIDEMRVRASRSRPGQTERAAVEQDLFAAAQQFAEPGTAPVDDDAPGLDEALDPPA